MHLEAYQAETASGGYAPGPGHAPAPAARRPLFRPEALAAAGGQPYGHPFGKAPMSWTVIGLFLAGITLAATIFLTTAQYARKETALGVLRAQGGETRINAQAGGVIRALYVRDGEIVAKGQKLALIGTEHALPGGGLMDEAMLASLAEEEATVLARVSALESGAPLEVQSLRAEQARLAAERQGALSTIETTQARLDLAQERLRAGATLMEQGFSTADELRRRQGEVITLQEALQRAQADSQAYAAQMAGVQARLAKLPFDFAQSRGQLEAQAASLAQSRAQMEGRRGYELWAPVAGRVSALQAVLGQSVDPAKPLMTLTPQGDALQAELYVPSRAIGFVQPGQRIFNKSTVAILLKIR